MDLKEFIASKLDKTNTITFDSGWTKTERIKKDAGSSEIKTTSKLFDAKQDGMPAELVAWLKDGKVSINQK